MTTREAPTTGEWYHCYNRGVDKRKTFETAADYERFMALIYACNGTKSISISDRYRHDLQSLLTDTTLERGEPLVEIGAFTLMPTHVHLLVLQLQDGGIPRFMQKVFTGYTMYFNQKSSRAGALFAGTYKAKHIADDRYLKQVVSYILLNSAELFEPRWKQGICSLRKLNSQLATYPHTSLREFSMRGVGGRITGKSLRSYYERLPTLPKMLAEAHSYYAKQSPEV